MTPPVITYNPYSGYTVPVYPVYNDQTFLVTASTSSRYSYKLLSDVIINGNRVATLQTYPFNGVLEVNPQNITSNYLLHDFNYSASPILDNPDAIKSVGLNFGEEYSRSISFSSITDASGLSYINLIQPTYLQGGDRIVVSLGSQTTFGRVGAVSGEDVLSDIPYSFFSSSGSGTSIEAVEYYDYDYNGFHTTNPHNFNVGDTVFLQMDSWSTGVLQLTGGTSGQISQVSVGGLNLLNSPVSYSTSLSVTLTDLAAAINTGGNASGYTAYNASGSDILHIYSTRYNGDETIGLPISATTTGTLSLAVTPSMYKVKGYDSTGEGWNPQLSGQYTIASVPTSTTFKVVESVSEYYNNQTGSERGTWYSQNNYVFTGLTSGGTYYVMNNSNFYNYADYPDEVKKHTFNPTVISNQPKGIFLTNKPRTSFNFYSTDDIETLDLLWEVNWNGSGTYNSGNQQGLYLEVFTGTSTTAQQYFVDISHYASGFTGSNLFWKKFSFGVGPWNINNIPSQYITPTPSGQLITDDVYKYQIVGNNGFAQGNYSEILTFNRQCKGNDFKYYQLVFLNKWGSFDYVPLIANYENDLSVERTQFDRKRESVFNPFKYGISVADRGKTDFYINSVMNIKLYSNWLTLDESNWLMEVFESPQVYLYCPQDNTTGIDITNLYPVNITDSDIKSFNDRSRMRQFEFNVIVSNTRINQKN